jgi:hypothetical protein
MDSKISDLTSATSLKSSDIIPVVNSLTTKKVTKSILNGRLLRSTSGIVHTGTISPTIIASVLIPANTIEDGDVLKFLAMTSSQSGSFTNSLYIYKNTTPSLTSATQLAFYNHGATSFWNTFERTFAIRPTSMVGYVGTSSQSTDMFSGTGAGTNSSASNSLDLSVDNYIIFSETLGGTSAQITNHLVSLTIE